MPRVFLSYVSEDLDAVIALRTALESRGIDVWHDKAALQPGQRWASEIDRGIRSGDFFIACFSSAYHAKQTRYMDEELRIAIDEVRRRRHDSAWFIPVRLDECDIPDWSIPPGENLSSLQWVDLFDNPVDAIERLVATILPHGGEAYIHHHYRYIYRIHAAGVMQVETTADLEVLKETICVGGSGWTARPRDLEVSARVERAGARLDQTPGITSLKETGGTYWWDTQYEPPLLRGDRVTVTDQFRIELDLRTFTRDSFHAFRPIRAFDWSIYFDHPLRVTRWWASCDYVRGKSDGHVLHEHTDPTSAIAHQFGELTTGGIYFLNWEYG
jgi:hypothetical protein